MQRPIRIGRVSSVNYDEGMLAVTYPDMDDSVTSEFPVFSLTDEYKMPNVGDTILVVHLSNGQSAGIVLGRFWSKANLCANPGKGKFRKEFAPSDAFGKCFLEYDDDSETMKLHVPKKLEIIVEEECAVTAKNLTLVTTDTTNTGKYTGAKDVVGEGTSLHNHTHAGVHGETAPPS